MGKRGAKPVDMRKLNVWEFEWYKALHLPRDGTQLRPDPVFVRVNRREAEAQLEWWKKVTPREIMGDLRLGSEPGRHQPLSRADVEYAELQRQSEIAQLQRQLKPAQTQALAERRKNWEALVQARTLATLEEACGRWKGLGDVRALGFACFADHVLTNAQEFFRMKRNRRFPRSSYADESRLEYLARGMAGVMMEVSPMTAIERLRNIKHTAGAPLWDETEKCCGCWRCQLQRSHALYKRLERFQLDPAKSGKHE